MKTATAILLTIMMLCAAPARSAIAVYIPHQDTTVLSATFHSGGDEDVKVVHHKKVGWFGIVAISSSFLGLLVGAIPFGLGGMVFGILGLVGKNKKMKGLAISGLILGVIDVIIGIAIVAAII